MSVLIALVAHSADLGPRLPHLTGTLPPPDALFPLMSGDGLRLASKYAYDILVAAAAIAVIGSLDSLLAAVGEMDGPLDTGQPNRLLIALGLGNIMSGLLEACRSPIHRPCAGLGPRRWTPDVARRGDCAHARAAVVLRSPAAAIDSGGSSRRRDDGHCGWAYQPMGGSGRNALGASTTIAN